MIGGLMTALLTPFDKDGNILTRMARPLLEFYKAQGAQGVYMLGFTGEGFCMTLEQRKEWTEAVAEAAKGFLPVVVNVGYSSDPQVGIELARHARECGVDAVSSVALTKDTKLAENVRYFRAVSEAAQLPFYVYWHFSMGNLNGGERIDSHELIDALTANIPTFTGFKYTDSNYYYMDRIKSYAPQVQMLTGVDQMCLAGKLMGADGCIGALQAVTCGHYSEMLSLLDAGKIPEAFELQHRANAIYEALDQPEVGGLIPGLKYIMKAYYGIDVGCVSPGAEYADVSDSGVASRLLASFTQNIHKA